MRICLKNSKKNITDNQFGVIQKFLSFLQKKVPLVNDFEIVFVKKRQGHMTTGVRKPGGVIQVLAGDRLLTDILRTIAHEWVHEFQHQKLNIGKKGKIKDIGGPEENMANALAGIFIKQFQKKYPEYEASLYNE